MWAEPLLTSVWHTIPRGVRGHVPPENLENAYSWRCIFLDFGAKSRADFYQVTSNKVMMN